MTAEPTDPAALEAWLRDSRQLQDPPEWATHRLLALWRPSPAAPEPQTPPLLRRVLAQLGFESAGAPLALGLRGASTAPQQWLFHAEEHDIELRLRPDPQQPEDRWQLAGQVLGPQAAGHLMLVPADGQGAAQQVALDELGDFQLDDLPAGRWLLSLALPDRQIELPPLCWPNGTAG